MKLAPGVTIARKYRLTRLIARGGMGSVWEALDLQLDRRVAIKFMDPHIADSGEARQRFEREAKAAAALRTPHVVQIHDHGVDDGTAFIVMEMLEGESLGQRLRRERRLTLAAASVILGEASKALRRAHEAGIVHRDLKPGNIFLARHDDDDEVVKILDFGIAKSAIQGPVGESTKTGELLGSPHYMSPEQARGLRSVDHRSDLWSMGVILYRSLTGELPFPGEALGDVIVRICSEPPLKPSQLVEGLPLALDEFFDRALARDAAQRFQSARDMAQALAQIAAAHPDSVPSTIPGMRSMAPGSEPTPASMGSQGSLPLPYAAAARHPYSGAPGAVPMIEGMTPSGPSSMRVPGVAAGQDSGIGMTHAGHTVPPRMTPGVKPAVLWAIGAATISVVLLGFGIFRFARSIDTASAAAEKATVTASANPAPAAPEASGTAAAAQAAEQVETAAPTPAPPEPVAPTPPATAKAAATSAPAAEAKPKKEPASKPAGPAPTPSNKKKPSFGY